MCICIEKRVMEMKAKSKLYQKNFVFVSIFFFFFFLLSKKMFQNYESEEITYLQRYILITDAQNFPDNS